MPAPLYGADDARRCSGNSVSEVLDKFRKNYDRIMSLPQETKEEKEFRHCIWLAEKEERERIYQTSIRPFRKATYIDGMDALVNTRHYCDTATATPAKAKKMAALIENWTPPDGWCNGNDRDWHEKMKGYICDFLRKCNGFRVM